VRVDGRLVNEASLPQEQLQGDSTTFSCLALEGSQPLLGQRAWVDFDGPHAMGRMQRRFQLHDDGLGCDLRAGDGEFCYDDQEGHYGPHHAGAHHGEYRYRFWVEHFDGRQSDRVTIRVTMTP
jgi:hypothetical protein